MYVYIVLVAAAILLIIAFAASKLLSIGLKIAGIVAVIVVFALLAGLASLTGSGKKTPAAALTPLTSTSSTSSTSTSTTVALNSDDIANQIGTVFQGFTPGEIAVGSRNVSFNGAAEERGTAGFSKRTLKTSNDVGNFLKENTDESRAARQRVADAIRKAGYGDSEINRALDGSGYFPVQVKVASQILGTTYFLDGKVLEAGEYRQVGPNDVFHLFLTRDGKIVFGATIRADCGNPDLKHVRPVRPDTPPAPPVECAVNCSVVSTTAPRVTTTRPGVTTTLPRVTTTRPTATTATTRRPAATTTTKPPTSEDCQQNGGPGCPFPAVQQPPQNNTTSGSNTGPELGAPAVAPTPSAPGPTPIPNTPAPSPVNPSNGGAPSIDSGSGTGSNTPGGSTCGASCSGGGPTPAAPGTPPVVDSGTYTTDDGGF